MKLRYVVQCLKHGSESKDWGGRQVVVGRPTSKKDRTEGGCPTCKADAIKAKQSQ